LSKQQWPWYFWMQIEGRFDRMDAKVWAALRVQTDPAGLMRQLAHSATVPELWELHKAGMGCAVDARRGRDEVLLTLCMRTEDMCDLSRAFAMFFDESHVLPAIRRACELATDPQPLRWMAETIRFWSARDCRERKIDLRAEASRKVMLDLIAARITALAVLAPRTMTASRA
jgi:hypothetical protein